RRRGDADDERAVALAAECRFLCPRNDPDLDLDAVLGRADSGAGACAPIHRAAPRSAGDLAGRVRVGVVGELHAARPVQQDPIVALARFLLLHELERVAQRLDARFDRDLDVLAFQLQTIDFALDVYDSRLRLIEV